MFQVHSNKMGLGSRLPHLRAHSSQWLLSPLTDDGVFLSRFGLLHPPQPTNHFSIFSNIIFPFFQFNIIYSFILYIYIFIWWERRVFDWFISSYCTSALLGSQICLILETESCQCKFFFLGFLFGGSVSVIEIWVLVGVLDLWCGVGVLDEIWNEPISFLICHCWIEGFWNVFWIVGDMLFKWYVTCNVVILFCSLLHTEVVDVFRFLFCF